MKIVGKSNMTVGGLRKREQDNRTQVFLGASDKVLEDYSSITLTKISLYL